MESAEKSAETTEASADRRARPAGGAGTAGAPAASRCRSEGPFLVVGLGNPGPGYAGNRHNVGAMVLDELADRAGIRLSPGKGARARALSGEGRLAGRRVVLARPLTYMNESGGPGPRPAGLPPPARRATSSWCTTSSTSRSRRCGSSAAAARAGTTACARSPARRARRTTCGCGSASAGRPAARTRPTSCSRTSRSTERKELDLLIVEAADATELLLARGLEAAQNEVHPRT